MDFETIGAICGMQNDLRGLEEVAQREINRLARELRAANETIRQMREELARTQSALAVETSHRMGITAQGRALKGEVARLDPRNRLLQVTGKAFATGKAQTGLDLVYEAAFDAHATKVGLPNPKALRAVAK